MRINNNFLLMTIAASLLFAVPACKKEKNEEEAIRFYTDALANAKSLGPNYVVGITIESAMPAAGVEIEYTLTGESDNLLIPQGPKIVTKGKFATFTLMNLPRQKYCVCKITVRSKSNLANSATVSFRIVYK
jgi:hypothetical protein